ncbi:FAD-dependent monooxygenase [Saccharomonospora azurea]|uniref:FAD-dependent monooxygenase n=1 Tax=Saccharomonospora azurea TaxID=40988 RepID=UPI00332D9972
MDAWIAGGGIGGLAAAAGLTRAGWRVRVSERGDALSSDGTGLVLWPAVVRELDRLGLGEELRQRAMPQPPGVLQRWDGRVLAEVDTERIRRRAGEVPYVVARPDLLALLFAALPEDTVRFGQPAPVDADADVLVGADGAHSAVRRRLAGPRHRLRDTGQTAWRGVIEAAAPHAGEVWGPGAKFGYTPLAAERTYFYAVLPTRLVEHHGDAPDHDLLLAHFGRWPAPVPSILRQADPARLLRHPLHYLAPRLPSYVGERTALLGDAAHTMTPDLGQGACQALLDAFTLARCLATASSGGDVAAALRQYDRLRRGPSQRVATAARWLGRISTARRGVHVRDALVRVASRVAR